MKKNFIFLGVCLASFVFCAGQPKLNRAYRNFPVTISLQFHSLSLPFKHFGSNFSNFGIGVGTEVSYSGRQDWVQQFNVAWHRNKNIGNSVLFSSQIVWRPTVFDNFFSEIKAGIGYSFWSRPVESYAPVNGHWTPVGRRGKGMFTILTGVSAGYNNYSGKTYTSPFVSYQFLLFKGYNKSIPVVPETMVEFGTRTHL